MRTLREFNVKNKRVLVRCDFNVPLDKKGEIQDDFKILQTIPTIKYLIDNEAKIILLSHLGRPKGEVIEELRLNLVAERLSKILVRPIKKLDDCIGKEIEKEIEKMQPKEVILLENIQFNPGERMNDPGFTKSLASYADIFILEAFGQSHRDYASISGLPKYLPSGAGFSLEKEVKILSKVLGKPWRPLVIIIGGVKIETKIKMIKQFLEKADHLLIGGKIANAILIAKGICVIGPWPEKKIVEEIEKLSLTSTKLHLPIDAIVSPDKTGKVYTRMSGPGKVRNDELLLDIGPETINVFSQVIKKAKMIVWSGPLGFFENPLFEKGTKEIAQIITRNHKAYKIVGGGDTLFAVSKFGFTEKFDHVSTGGGAMLSFLSGEELPGLKALERQF